RRPHGARGPLRRRSVPGGGRGAWAQSGLRRFERRGVVSLLQRRRRAGLPRGLSLPRRRGRIAPRARPRRGRRAQARGRRLVDRPLAILRAGAGAATPLGFATSFSLSPSGAELAVLSTAKAPGEAAGELLRVPLAAGQPRPLASRAVDFRFAPSGDLLFLAAY